MDNAFQVSDNRSLSRRDLLALAGSLALIPATGVPMSAAPVPARLPYAKPEEIGLDPKQLQIAYDLLESWTSGAKPSVPSGAIIVGRKGKAVAPRFFGKMGPEPDAPVIREDCVFLMASITKPMVYMVAMQLVERGLLNLNDPVQRYVPEFKGPGKENVLVLHLFTHTSGLPDMLPNNAELRRQHTPLQAFLDAAARDSALLFRPGTRLSYQSMGTAVVAEIVQRLTGKSIIDVLRLQLFEPLGMKSTSLGAKGLATERIVRATIPDYQVASNFDWNSDYWRNLGAPWGGMFSSPDDFARICLMLLGKGSWMGVKILSPVTVQMMTTNRLRELPDLPESVARTQPWGLGWRLNHPGSIESWGDLLGREVFGHTGATGTTTWMDPATDTFCLLLTNAIREKAPWKLVHLSNAIAAAIM